MNRALLQNRIPIVYAIPRTGPDREACFHGPSAENSLLEPRPKESGQCHSIGQVCSGPLTLTEASAAFPLDAFPQGRDISDDGKLRFEETVALRVRRADDLRHSHSFSVACMHGLRRGGWRIWCHVVTVPALQASVRLIQSCKAAAHCGDVSLLSLAGVGWEFG